MEAKQSYNALPEDKTIYDGEQRRETKFDSNEELLAFDAKGLIAKAKKEYKRKIVTVADAFDLRSRKNDHNPEDLRRAIAIEIKNPEHSEIDERLKSLVVEPINALPEAARTVKGKVRSGEEIARAIPDVEAFLEAMSLRKEGKFFELNETGQLVMVDGCPEAYGLGEDFPTAKMRQACVWYLDEQGVTQSLQGEELYTVKEVDGKEFGVRGKIQVLELTEAAKTLVPTMVSGLPNLKWDGERHTGEYARMNIGQLERAKITWTEDDSLDGSRARFAVWADDGGGVCSDVDRSGDRLGALGSRGVLRVNLNFES